MSLDWVSIILVACSAFTSFLTAASGLGGGLVLFAAMAAFLPVFALIPVHGVVQIGSNAGRMALMFQNIKWVMFWPFFLGSLLGAATGAAIAFHLPQAFLQIALACFILWSAWSKHPSYPSGRTALAITGLISTFLTMFFGATGVFVAAALKTYGLQRLALISTHATFMVAQHGVKVIAFGLLGFAYGDYFLLIVLMIVGGIFGTWAGRLVLIKMSEIRFQRLMSGVLTLLAIHLLWKGFGAMI